ncbi:MAG: lysine--tRNA ligase [Patescibacteria group bacterium]
MSSLEEIRTARLEKLKLLEEKGVDPFPVESRQDVTISEAKESFDQLSSSEKTSFMVGRILAIREQGKIIFLTFSDGTGNFQALLKSGDPLPEEDFELFRKAFDIGDFLELKGTFFLTQKGEKTILVESLRMLAKSLRPLPEKWHGLQDVEERFRKRYLDLISNPEVKERFIIRSKALALIREFYSKAGYVEVDLPNLQPLAGGATAAPFKTHHNALDMDFFLPVAQELYLKELLVGGMNKVFEIGKRFRNEGIDTMHNPEFTMLESNEAYADAKSQREFIEKLFKFVVKGVFGKYEVECNGEIIDFGLDFEIVTFYELLRRYADIENPEKLDREEAARVAEKLGVDVAPEDMLEKILDNIYKKTARPKLIQPTFIIDYPVAFNPFAKRKPENPKLIDRFQLLVAGMELVNAFSELNNPLDQKARYLEQDEKGSRGEKEISPSDLEYLEAMEHGMPPNGGIGIGIDRLVMLLTNVDNIKEVILFPTLRPRG